MKSGNMIPGLNEQTIQNGIVKVKVIIISGPRQLGKTTLLENLKVSNGAKAYPQAVFQSINKSN
jgi:predicted AAA+ superfamily ATPase